ncbi:MAG TPA: LysR substrate-binding domain-containing protein [Gemmatimonadaceae bacterium]|nr:LysR substrate-binding domain-containing protein [Gemmatimonadaceae bacterium]
MELRHLRYFVAVAEELHFGRAAQRLNIAQPPLSRQIRDLERDLEVPLFERIARGVQLTAAGRAFLPQARLTLALAERARRAAQRAAQGEVGRLRIGFVDAATSSDVLPDVLGFFRMHLPQVGVSLFEMDSAQQEDALREGRIDVGILQRPPADAERWLVLEEIYRDALVAAVPEGHRLATRGRLSMEDLRSEAIVLLFRSADPELWDSIIARCRAVGFSPRVIQEAGAWHTLAGVVSAGVGIAFVPRSLASIRRPGVVFRPVKGLSVELTLHAAWKRGEKSPVRDRFLTALRALVRGERKALAGRSSSPRASRAAGPAPRERSAK